ncbi:MAG: hypothetical protein ACK40T_05910 [Akkermansiaceae bacterium]|jgi:hypothetical protein
MNPQPKKYKPFGWRFWLLLIGCIVILCSFAFNSISFDRTRSYRAEAVSNLKQIGYALYDYQDQYGTYPNDLTAKQHPSEFNLSGSSSNAIFRQLFAADIVENEQIFYANFPRVSRPDGDISSGHLLEKGEVAFAYIAGLSIEDKPSLPIAFGPIIPGTIRFDPKPLNGKAIVLRIDGSISVLKLRPDGHAISAGESLLDPDNSLWKGKAPDIRYPE